MNEIILESVVDKVNEMAVRMEAGEQVVNGIQQNLVTVREQSDQQQQVAAVVKELQSKLAILYFPVQEMKELSSELAHNNRLRSTPRKEIIRHRHTGEKLWYFTIGLGVLLIIAVNGWIRTYNRVSDHEKGALLWRYMKVNAPKDKLRNLQELETSFAHDPEQFKSIVEGQELKQSQLLEAKQKAGAAQEELQKWQQAAGESAPVKPVKKKGNKAKQ